MAGGFVLNKMDIKDLHRLLEELAAQADELSWLEFKMNAGSITNEDIGKYISAMSNGACIANQQFGFLVWGVENKTHQIKGTNFYFSTAKQGNQDLELWLRTMIHPKINFEILEFEYHWKHIVLLRIPSAKSEPTNFQKKAFIRINSQTTDLQSYPEYLRVIYNSLEDWSAKIIEKASTKDLDDKAIVLAREKFKEKYSNDNYYSDIDKWDDLTFLDKAKITINGKITNTSLVLLGKPESSHYFLPSIAEITWKLETDEKAYEHFTPPLLINTSNLLKRIRNVKYKFFPASELLATTVDKYEPKVILEALNNCIAHQDYYLHSRIIVEEKTDKLIFSNAGGFFAGKAEDYVLGKKTPERYRNPWLAKAMVNLNMIDTMGYGIHTMFLEQRKRFFPLPDYSKSDTQKVILEIYGHAIDENYSRLLIEKRDLPLSIVILLDRIQKKQTVTDDAVSLLRKDKLIEGRKPNFYVSAHIAEATGDKVQYIKNRSFDDRYFKDLILEYLKTFGSASKEDIDNLIVDKLPDALDKKQKENKVRNLVYSLSKRKNFIRNEGTNRKPIWKSNI